MSENSKSQWSSSSQAGIKDSLESFFLSFFVPCSRQVLKLASNVHTERMHISLRWSASIDVCPGVWSKKRMSLMSSSLLLQQEPALDDWWDKRKLTTLLLILEVLLPGYTQKNMRLAFFSKRTVRVQEVQPYISTETVQHGRFTVLFIEYISIQLMTNRLQSMPFR